MNVLVIGAAGKSGEALVNEALAAGHNVTAFVRGTSQYRKENVRVVAGDVLDAAAVDIAVAGQDEVLKLDVKAFALPRAAWADAFQQFGVPKGHTEAAEELYEGVNVGSMDLGVAGTEHVAGKTSAREVFAAAQNAAKAKAQAN